MVLQVPCISALFSAVPVEQGVMQGIAGAIDRFGQAFGPIVGGIMLKALGEAMLMRCTARHSPSNRAGLAACTAARCGLQPAWALSL